MQLSLIIPVRKHELSQGHQWPFYSFNALIKVRKKIAFAYWFRYNEAS